MRNLEFTRNNSCTRPTRMHFQRALLAFSMRSIIGTRIVITSNQSKLTGVFIHENLGLRNSRMWHSAFYSSRQNEFSSKWCRNLHCSRDDSKHYFEVLSQTLTTEDVPTIQFFSRELIATFEITLSNRIIQIRARKFKLISTRCVCVYIYMYTHHRQFLAYFLHILICNINRKRLNGITCEAAKLKKFVYRSTRIVRYNFTSEIKSVAKLFTSCTRVRSNDVFLPRIHFSIRQLQPEFHCICHVRALAVNSCVTKRFKVTSLQGSNIGKCHNSQQRNR